MEQKGILSFSENVIVYGKTSDHIEIDISAFSESKKSIFVRYLTSFLCLIKKARTLPFNSQDNNLFLCITTKLLIIMGICAGKPATKTTEDPNSQVEPVENGFQVNS